MTQKIPRRGDNVRVRFVPLLLIASALAFGDVRNCSCDTANAESMAKRECGLCREAEKQPAGVAAFLLKDSSPHKPNRWLALPRTHAHSLADLTPAQRTALWTTAITKARELWGDQWGLAVNGVVRRSQCHIHIHIGKRLDDTEAAEFITVDGPADIPLPKDDSGVFVEPAGGKLRVHLGDDAPELLLMR